MKFIKLMIKVFKDSLSMSALFNNDAHFIVSEKGWEILKQNTMETDKRLKQAISKKSKKGIAKSLKQNTMEKVKITTLRREDKKRKTVFHMIDTERNFHEIGESKFNALCEVWKLVGGTQYLNDGNVGTITFEEPVVVEL